MIKIDDIAAKPVKSRLPEQKQHGKVPKTAKNGRKVGEPPS